MIRRLGAVGIYSKNLPYTNFVKNNYDSTLENDLDLWCKTIYFLLDNSRDQIYKNALRLHE